MFAPRASRKLRTVNGLPASYEYGGWYQRLHRDHGALGWVRVERRVPRRSKVSTVVVVVDDIRGLVVVPAAQYGRVGDRDLAQLYASRRSVENVSLAGGTGLAREGSL